jgi:P4 family phage/plasmid primase-like protien
MSLQLQPGEINFAFLPENWAYVCCNDRKQPTHTNWNKQPLSKSELQLHFDKPGAYQIGILCGPLFNEPEGIVCVDVDGSSIEKLIPQLSGLPLEQALPPTLTILSGKEGRQKRFYKLHKRYWNLLPRTKYREFSDVPGEQLEILWREKNAVVMGKRKDTAGYYTPEGLGFEWANNLPELPDWISKFCVAKDKKRQRPKESQTRIVTQGSAINIRFNEEYELKKCRDATMSLPTEAADDRDIWLKIGMAIHSEFGDNGFDIWDEFSQKSEKYKQGETWQKWKDFQSDGGLGIGTLYQAAIEAGWSEPRDYDANLLNMIDLEEIEKELRSVEAMHAPALPPSPPLKKPVKTAWDTAKQSSSAAQNSATKKNISPQEITGLIIAYFEGNFKYCLKTQSFWQYNHKDAIGVWTRLDFQAADSVIYCAMLQANNLMPFDITTRMIDTVTRGLKNTPSIMKDKWEEDTRFICFRNGYIDRHERKLRPHDREMYFKNQMPMVFDPDADCPQIKAWLLNSQSGDEDRMQVCRAIAGSVLIGEAASKLQVFYYFYGRAATGKSTFARMCQALIGRANFIVTSLRELENNKFETALLIDKKLAYCGEVEKFASSCSVLKQATGGDDLKNETKGKMAGPNFVFKGAFIGTSNFPFKHSDDSEAIARRIKTVYFDNPFKGEKQNLIGLNANNEIEGKFSDEMPGFVNWILELDDQTRNTLCTNPEKLIPFYADKRKIEHQDITINRFMDEMLVYIPNTHIAVGQKRKFNPGDGNGRIVQNWDRQLYPAYLQWLSEQGSKAEPALRNFLHDFQQAVDATDLDLIITLHQRVKSVKDIQIRLPGSTAFDGYPSLLEYIQAPSKYDGIYQQRLGQEFE